MKKIFLSILFLCLFIPLISSVTLDSTNAVGVVLERPALPLNVTTGDQVFNLTDIWVTDEGLMDNVPDLYPTLDLRYLELDGSNFGFVDNWISYSDPNFAFNELLFNDSVKKLFTEQQVVYNATSIETVNGTFDGGDLDSILVLGDGDTYNVSENSGSEPLRILINFTNVVNFNTVAIRGRYEGGSGHTLDFELFRVGVGWEEREEVTDQIQFGVTTFQVFIGSDFIDELGTVRFRINHDDNGIPSHDYFIDAVFIGQVTGLVSGGALGDLTGRGDACALLPDVFCKDGNKTATGNFNWGGFNISNIGTLISDFLGTITNRIDKLWVQDINSNGTVNSSQMITDLITLRSNGETTDIEFMKGGYLELDGSSCLNVSDDNSLDFGTGDFGFSIWFKTESDGFIYFFDKGINNPPQRHTWGYFGGGLPGIRAQISPTNLLTGITTANDGMWHHMVYTRSGSTLSQYFDGVLNSTDTSSADVDSADNMMIGCRGDGITSFWLGNLDEFMIFGKTLDSGDVTTLYNLGRNKDFTDENLVSHWDFNIDFTDNKGSNDGVGVGSPVIILEDVVSFEDGSVNIKVKNIIAQNISADSIDATGDLDATGKVNVGDVFTTTCIIDFTDSSGVVIDCPFSETSGNGFNVASDAVFGGDIDADGKITGSGGVDPPYVLYDMETRQSIVDRVREEITISKAGGMAQFYNQDENRIEYFKPLTCEFYVEAYDTKTFESYLKLIYTWDDGEVCYNTNFYWWNYYDRITDTIKNYTKAIYTNSFPKDKKLNKTTGIITDKIINP